MNKKFFYLLSCIFSTSANGVGLSKVLLSLMLPIYSTSFMLTPVQRQCTESRLHYQRGSDFESENLINFKAIMKEVLYLRFKQINPEFNEEIIKRAPLYEEYFEYYFQQFDLENLPKYLDKSVHFDHWVDSKASGGYEIGKLLTPGTSALWSGKEAEIRGEIYKIFAKDFTDSDYNSLLSIGCGGGKCLGTFYEVANSDQELNSNFKMYGIDLMPGPLADCKTTLQLQNTEVTDKTTLNIADATKIDSLWKGIQRSKEIDSAFIHFVNHETPMEITLKIFDNLEKIGVKKVYWLDLHPQNFISYHEQSGINGCLVKNMMLLSEPYFLELNICNMVSSLKSRGWSAQKIEISEEIIQLTERFPIDAYIFKLN